MKPTLIPTLFLLTTLFPSTSTAHPAKRWHSITTDPIKTWPRRYQQQDKGRPVLISQPMRYCFHDESSQKTLGGILLLAAQLWQPAMGPENSMMTIEPDRYDGRIGGSEGVGADALRIRDMTVGSSGVGETATTIGCTDHATASRYNFLAAEFLPLHFDDDDDNPATTMNTFTHSHAFDFQSIMLYDSDTGAAAGSNYKQPVQDWAPLYLSEVWEGKEKKQKKVVRAASRVYMGGQGNKRLVEPSGFRGGDVARIAQLYPLRRQGEQGEQAMGEGLRGEKEWLPVGGFEEEILLVFETCAC
ncbi:Hypothetical predicted protein [Lecanosticta acicola]|uniref:Uncharacterized protein n=1 Tax=Lecanosticta acicola TaxID=111012 RepID=A0AAI9E7R5_9PEZI|nr:Hypothetical predicted protein [Lecanosticta acicola]